MRRCSTGLTVLRLRLARLLAEEHDLAKRHNAIKVRACIASTRLAIAEGALEKDGKARELHFLHVASLRHLLHTLRDVRRSLRGGPRELVDLGACAVSPHGVGASVDRCATRRAGGPVTRPCEAHPRRADFLH